MYVYNLIKILYSVFIRILSVSINVFFIHVPIYRRRIPPLPSTCRYKNSEQIPVITRQKDTKKRTPEDVLSLSEPKKIS